MEIIETYLKGLYQLRSVVIPDERGYFTRTFCKREFSAIGLDEEFVQFNQSFNLKKGTIRGMHFQLPPFSEVKLIRCVQGRVLDVAVDLRKNSSTYLNYFSIELSDKNMCSILIPKGFAHGFQTLEDNTTLIYHHTNFFTPNVDSGVRYDDPLLNIKWPLPVSTISEKDLSYKNIIRN